jgi:phosphatidylglycerol---prolipoprotein diacylglyceryl transferase
MHLSALVWNVNPIILPLGENLKFSWYGLLFAATFFCGYIILSRFFKKEGKDPAILDKLAIYMALGTVIGARLGHCFFYEPEYYLANPLEILKVYKGGLASHGGAIGIALALSIFSLVYKYNLVWLLERIAIVTALGGLFIRSGNLMNSEIYGIPTESHYGFIYGRDLTEDLLENEAVDKVKYKKSPGAELVDNKYLPLNLLVKFESRLRNKEKVESFTETIVKNTIIGQKRYAEENIKLPAKSTFDYHVKQNDDRSFSAVVPVLSVPRHPTHIYEALSYFLIFLLLMYLYYRSDAKERRGFIMGLFFVLLFTARFFIEIIKEEQVEKEVDMVLNLGQKLSLPFIGLGVVIIVLSYMYGKKPLEKAALKQEKPAEDKGSQQEKDEN